MKLPARDLAGMSLGIEMVLSVLVMGAFGRWLDRRLHTEPAFILLGVLLGAAAGFRQILRYTERLDRLSQRDADEEKRAKREGPPPDDGSPDA
jgi:ATP synthase protein I